MCVKLFFPFDIPGPGSETNVEVVFPFLELETVCNFYADVGLSE